MILASLGAQFISFGLAAWLIFDILYYHLHQSLEFSLTQTALWGGMLILPVLHGLWLLARFLLIRRKGWNIGWDFLTVVDSRFHYCLFRVPEKEACQSDEEFRDDDSDLANLRRFLSGHSSPVRQ